MASVAASVMAIIVFASHALTKDQISVRAKRHLACQWDGDELPSMGETIPSNMEWQLVRGLVDLQNESGTRTSILGPARFQIADDGGIVLTSGRLFVEVSEKDHGYTVETPHGDLIDLGTRFRASVNDDGSTKAEVFEGRVRLEIPNKPAIEIVEGEAFRWSADRSPKAVTLGVEPPRDRLPSLIDARGDLRVMTGDARVLPKNTWKKAVVFMESPLTVLPRDLQVINGTSESSTLTTVPSGTQVTSYLIHAGSIGTPNADGGKQNQIKGSLRFERPVLGLHLTKDQLESSDDIFSYESHRGVWEQHHGSSRGLDIRDNLSVKPVGKGHQIDFELLFSRLDQVRILVAQSPEAALD